MSEPAGIKVTDAPYFYSLGHAVLRDDRRLSPSVDVQQGLLTNVDVAILPRGDAQQAERFLVSLIATYPALDGKVFIPGAISERWSEELDASVQAWLGERSSRLSSADEVDFKNRVLAESTSDWVWFLSPEVFFTAEPVSVACLEIDVLRAQVVNFARKTPADVYLARDHLEFSVEHGDIVVDLRPAVAEAMRGRGSPALCTGFDSASVLLDRRHIAEVGEFRATPSDVTGDLDMSLRLLAVSTRIVVSRAVVFLSDESPRTDRVRWDDWKGTGLPVPESLGLHERSPQPYPAAWTGRQDHRPRVALVIDQTGWAFDNIATQIIRYLGDRYAFTRIPLHEVGGLRRALLLAEASEHLHCFWREVPHELFSVRFMAALRDDGIDAGRFMDDYVRPKRVTTTIYDHLWMSDEDIALRRDMFVRLDGYSVANRTLEARYSRPELLIPPPVAVTQDGVDTGRFTPAAARRPIHRPLVIGWVGNSRWGDPHVDTKGLRTVIRPALAELRRRGIRFEELVVDRVDGHVSHVTMPMIYRRMDILVIASSMEGTPNPLLEAMATGVAIVATDVGIVREALGELQSQYILRDRDPSTLVEVLEGLIADPKLVRLLGEENRATVIDWDWRVRAEAYATLFDPEP